MFNEQVGGQVAWLIPLAAVGLLIGLWTTRRAPRGDRRRAAWVLFGLWALIDIAVFSSQQGIFHPYYVSALAPAIAALAAGGVLTLVKSARRSWAGAGALCVAIALTASVVVVLLGRTPSFSPSLRIAIPIAGAIALAGVLALRLGVGGARGRGMLSVAAVAAAVAILAGPASYSLATVGRSLDGNNVLAGPASAASGFGGAAGGPGGTELGRTSSATPPSGSGLPSRTSVPSGAGAGMGGGQLSKTVIAYLEAHQGTATYLLAATGSRTTAPIIIETGRAVVTIGAFNGGDPPPTVSQLAKMVSAGELKYVLISSGGTAGGGQGGSSSASQAITSWVKAHGTAVTAVSVTGSTLYRVG